MQHNFVFRTKYYLGDPGCIQWKQQSANSMGREFPSKSQTTSTYTTSTHICSK